MPPNGYCVKCVIKFYTGEFGMKKIVLFLLAVIVTACAAPTAAPTQELVAAVVEPTATPVVVVQTVVVEATQAPTDVPAPTAVPPTAEPVVVTVVVQPTNPPATTDPGTASSGLISIDTALGKGVFTAMTISSANLTLRCSPRDVTFNITTPNADIADVQFYYRVVDLKRLYPSEWKALGKFVANGGGNFTYVFKGEDVHSDLRIDGSYIDFQFVGLAKSGNVVDRSEKIESLLTYTFDCP
jgi:hypothetical protein